MHNAIPSRSSQSPSSLPGSCTSSDLNTPITSPKQPSRTSSKLNPLNWMPFELSQSRATDQRTHLPLERTISSIPRGDSDSNWEYPSPQQMYNAMLRKGFDDTPEDDVESMVAVHNFLNEGAWHEIEAWEERFSRGLSHGWQMCSMGEEESERRRASSTVAATDEQANLKPKLIRFQGRPNEITPKARMWAFMGKIYPSKFAYVLIHPQPITISFIPPSPLPFEHPAKNSNDAAATPPLTATTGTSNAKPLTAPYAKSVT